MRSILLKPISKTCCLLLVLLCVFAIGCKPSPEPIADFSIETWENYGPENPNPSTMSYTLVNGEPSSVEVQHVLITYSGKAKKKKDRRSNEESHKIALDILKKAQSGEDFDKLVETYTEDSYPGIYIMSNHGVAMPFDKGSKFAERGQMVEAFGDTAFSLEVGQIEITAKDGSPFGWHIIKRLK